MNNTGFFWSLFGMSLVVGIFLFYMSHKKHMSHDTVALLGALIWFFGNLVWTVAYLKTWQSEQSKKDKSGTASAVAGAITLSFVLIFVLPFVAYGKSTKKLDFEDFDGDLVN